MFLEILVAIAITAVAFYSLFLMVFFAKHRSFAPDDKFRLKFWEEQ